MHLKTLPTAFIVFLFILSSCNTANILTGNNATDQGSLFKNAIYKPQPVTTSFYDADTSLALQDSFSDNDKPSSLTDLPISADGSYILSSGFYEGDFESYCLHPGTHGPSTGDGYLFAPLKGSRKDVVETILHNAAFDQSHNQRKVQLLLWSILSRANYKTLPTDLKVTANQLLSPKQIFELNGGALGLVPGEITDKINSRMPVSLKKIMETESKMRQLFASGMNRYEDFERYAVLPEPSRIDRPEIKRGRWSNHPDGYYIRFFPHGYQRTTIQVYVPESLHTDNAETDSLSTSGYLTFDPSNIVAVPANSQAQRIGIGGPWGKILKRGGDILRKKQPPRLPAPAPPRVPAPPPPPPPNGEAQRPGKGDQGNSKTSNERKD